MKDARPYTRPLCYGGHYVMKPTGGGHWRTGWPMERGMDSIRHPAQDGLELFHFISLIIKCINICTKHK